MSPGENVFLSGRLLIGHDASRNAVVTLLLRCPECLGRVGEESSLRGCFCRAECEMRCVVGVCGMRQYTMVGLDFVDCRGSVLYL